MTHRTLLYVLLLAAATGAQTPLPEDPLALLREGENQQQALQVNEAIYQAIGFGNTFLVTTREGNVIIDTSSALPARRHLKLLKAVSAGPVRYIILTHGHPDHTSGVPLWKEAGTQIIAQQEHVEFVQYQTRLAGFFAVRNAAQFSLPRPVPGPWAGNYGAKLEPTIFFGDKYEFTLGGVRFEIYHTPGETPDHLTVWIPQYRTAFTGDNYYESFPNLYTLRGTKPRWALDYVRSLDRVMALQPEIVLPSHGLPVRGNARITERLARYRDAIQYVHDAVVKGMNDGKDVYTLMGETRLPGALEVGESYGKLSWSIRGIYEGYAGWFDMDPATMYEQAPSSVYPDLVKLAGGPRPVVERARARLEAGQPVEALRLTDVALAAEAGHRPALEMRLRALEALRARCHNSNERGWLDYSIATARGALEKAK